MVRKVVVDLWKTGLHSVEVGIKKDAEHQAKSRQFTQDTDIIGEYDYPEENLKGYLTIRKDPWEADLSEKRLIMKIFTESMNWKGTVEELVAEGITQSLGADEPMPVYILNLTNYDHLIRLERVFKPRSMNKAMYVFKLIDDEGNLIPYRIEADRLTFGSDWDVFDQFDHKVAKVDGKKFNVGGKFEIEIDDETHTFHPAFDEVILMFAALAKYEDDVRDKLEKAAKKFSDKGDEFQIKLSNEEIDLYDNPRRVRY